VQLVKDLGFNGVRVHQKIEDPRFLAWCDRLGLLVWAEMPSAYEFSTRTVRRLTSEWQEALERDRSHPCVIAWVPMNESWGVPEIARSAPQQDLVRALYHLTRAVDPTRPVIGNDGWEQLATDVLTVHDYTARGEVLRERYGDRKSLEDTLASVQPGSRAILLPGATVAADAPVVISEFGGISLDLDADGTNWGGYGSVRTPEELLAGYRDLVGALLDSPVLAGFCWTQLTDVQQERNGLATAQRRPKAAVEQLRAVTTGLAAALPGDAVGQLPHRGAGDPSLGADPGAFAAGPRGGGLRGPRPQDEGVVAMTEPDKNVPSDKVEAAGEKLTDGEMVEAVAGSTDSASEHASEAGKDWDGDPSKAPQVGNDSGSPASQ
jgi:hypothetical protein